MKTYLDCIPCFLKQALDAGKLAGADEITQKAIIDEVSRAIADFPLDSTPPAMARIIYGIIKEKTQKFDPFEQIKDKSNKLALALYPELKEKIKRAKDKLLTAVEIAIAGNVIDYGVKSSLNIEKELDKLFKENFKKADKKIFDYAHFKKDVKKAKKILYIADNAGEVVFDRILIEQLNKFGKKVIYAVRSKPAINDALMEDAITCGINKIARVIPSGSDAPGTILRYCTGEFLKLYRNAKLIISKGQGNYETLSEAKRPIYFLFKAKCPVVAGHIGCKLASTVLKKL